MATTANILTPIMGKILARGLTVLRKKCLMPQLVNSDFSADAAKKGSTIDIPLPSTASAHAVTPAEVPPAPAQKKVMTWPIKLDQWQASDFQLSDKDQAEIDRNALFVPQSTIEAVGAIADAVNANILSNYKEIYGFVGTAGTTPFGTNVEDASAINARKMLGNQLCPKAGRFGVLDADAEAAALALAVFKNVHQSGSNSVVQEGELGRKFGIDWYQEDAIPTHTVTAFSAGAVTINGVNAAGVGADAANRIGTVSIAKITNAHDLKKGDILNITGFTQNYVVAEDVTLAVGNTTVKISPPLKQATAGGEAVTLKATHVVNIVGNRELFGYATRTLLESNVDGLGNYMTMQDPVSRLVMRLEVSRQYKQTVWEFDILWGSACPRPEFGIRLAG